MEEMDNWLGKLAWICRGHEADEASAVREETNCDSGWAYAVKITTKRGSCFKFTINDARIVLGTEKRLNLRNS